MENKFKVDNRVIAIKDESYYKTKGKTGKIIYISNPERPLVEFDENVGGHGDHGGKQGHCLYCESCDLKLIPGSWAIVIQPDKSNPDVTTAAYYQDGKKGNEVSVKRFRDDTYNRDIAITNSLKRLAGLELPCGIAAKASDKWVADIGDKIKVVDAKVTCGNYKNGDILTVTRKYDHAVMALNNGVECVVWHQEYVIVSEKGSKPSVKEVKRYAEVGEYIKVVELYRAMGYVVGDILKVTNKVSDAGSVFAKKLSDSTECHLIEREYVVLEGYKGKQPETPAQNWKVVIHPSKGSGAVADTYENGNVRFSKLYKFESVTQIAKDIIADLEQPIAVPKTEPKANPVKEVNRNASKGEYIKIVNPSFSEDCYKTGDIFKVVETDGRSVRVNAEKPMTHIIQKPGSNAYIMREEYVVLEGYQPPKTEPVKPSPEDKVKAKLKVGSRFMLMSYKDAPHPSLSEETWNKLCKKALTVKTMTDTLVTDSENNWYIHINSIDRVLDDSEVESPIPMSDAEKFKATLKSGDRFVLKPYGAVPPCGISESKWNELYKMVLTVNYKNGSDFCVKEGDGFYFRFDAIDRVISA